MRYSLVRRCVVLSFRHYLFYLFALYCLPVSFSYRKCVVFCVLFIEINVLINCRCQWAITFFEPRYRVAYCMELRCFVLGYLC